MAAPGADPYPPHGGPGALHLSPAMNDSGALAAVLWTGGKDSALAMHEAQLAGCSVRCLATFAPPEPAFLAHPLAIIKLQAQALGLPHFVWPVREPFHESYEAGLRWLKETIGVDRSEEHTSELRSHSFISYAVFCLK